ncbi:MAG: cation diffusion facilitator family transporter [Planctomycetota bacterium]
MSSHEHAGHVDSHGVVDPTILTTARGIWAIKWSFIILFATSMFQIVVVFFSGSVALLADTVHNLGDAVTTLPLWITFRLARWEPNNRFTYGYGRVEDLAGIVIVVAILFSAFVAGYESINRIFHLRAVEYLWAVAIAAAIGFIGNEAVARFRIKAGKEISSAVLVADGYHARVDGLASLAVLIGATGVWIGYPLADPVVGLFIVAVIFRIAWDSGKTVITRLIDGVDPEVIEEVRYAAGLTPEVHDVTEVRVRWLGHRLHAEVSVAVNPEHTVEKGHEIANAAQRQLLRRLNYLSDATIHVDPVGCSGEEHEHIVKHGRWDLLLP